MTESLKYIIESLLMVSDSPLSADRLREVVDTVELKDIREAVTELTEEYENRAGGFFLTEVAGGYQLCTRPEYAEWVKRLMKPNPVRISKAALETLAIIAYKQPIIRNDVERVRGVDSGGVLRMLLERKLVRVLGRREIPGRPLIYATTKQFLELFNLKDLKDLPSPKEIESMSNIEIVDEDPLPLGSEDQDQAVMDEESEVDPNQIEKENLRSEDSDQTMGVSQDVEASEEIDETESQDTVLPEETDFNATENPVSHENGPHNEDVQEESESADFQDTLNQETSGEGVDGDISEQSEPESLEAEHIIQGENEDIETEAHDASNPIKNDSEMAETEISEAISVEDENSVLGDETISYETGNSDEEAVSDEEKTLDLKEDKPI